MVPLSSPGVCDSESAVCVAVYLRYSVPAAKLMLVLANGDEMPVSPEKIACAWPSEVLLSTYELAVRNASCSAVMLPVGPKALSGTQPVSAGLTQPVPVASSASLMRDVRR